MLAHAILERVVDDVLGLSVAGLPVRDAVFPAAQPGLHCASAPSLTHTLARAAQGM